MRSRLGPGTDGEPAATRQEGEAWVHLMSCASRAVLGTPAPSPLGVRPTYEAQLSRRTAPVMEAS